MPESTEERLVRIEATEAARADLFRGLGTLIADFAVMREREEKLRTDLNDGLAGVRADIAALETQQALDRRDREQLERARAAEAAARVITERKDRFIRVTTMFALVFTAIGTTAAVIALVVH